MTDPTLTLLSDLDRAHDAMQADPADDAARLAFYQALADAEVFLLLQDVPEGEAIQPEMLELDGDTFALVFDTDWRLSNFTEEHLPGAAMPYAALPGRAVAAMLKGQKVGLGLNLGVAPSSILIPQAAIDWLATTLEETPEETAREITGIDAAGALSDQLLPALIAKLSRAGGLASSAALATARFSDGTQGPLVGFTAPLPGAEQALARSVQEALVFSGIEDLVLEVAFFAPGSPEASALDVKGQPIPLPLPEPESEALDADRRPPGSDPERPPNLKS